MTRFAQSGAVAALAIACAIGATAPRASTASAAAIDPDAVYCGYSKVREPDATSNEAVNTWLTTIGLADWKQPTRSTTAKDPLSLDLAPSKNFLGHVGGGGGSRIVYDPTHRLLALCQVYDTAAASFLASNVPAPPFAVAHGDLSRARTAHGITIGSPVSAVIAEYGAAPMTAFNGTKRGLAYLRTAPLPNSASTPFSVFTWFATASGRVTAIERFTGV